MMKRSRTTKAIAVVALVAASGVVAYAAVQAARRGAVKDTSSVVVASVNGEKITRGEIFDSLLQDEAARLSATDAQAKASIKQQRQTGVGMVGALVLQKMAKNGWKPVTVTREELMDYAFTDKPQSVVRAVELAVQEKAIAQEAKKQGLVATPDEISKQISSAFDTARKQNPALAGKSDVDVMKAYGVRKGYFQPIAATQVSLEKIVKKEMEAKLGHPLGNNDYLAASHILVRVNPVATPVSNDPKNPKPAEDPEKPWADAKKKAEGILADIRSGKMTFEQAAQQNSDDGSKFKGGSLGVFTRGQMVPEFEKAAFSQEKGKVGEPVRSQFGWHIIRVDKTGAELTGPERAEVMKNLVAGKAGAKVQEIMAKAKVENNVKAEMEPGMPMMGGPGAPMPGRGPGVPGRR